MAREFNPASYGFDKEDGDLVRDFIAATHNGEFAEIIRRAVPFYIRHYLDENPGTAKDFEAARAKREANEAEG